MQKENCTKNLCKKQIHQSQRGCRPKLHAKPVLNKGFSYLKDVWEISSYTPPQMSGKTMVTPGISESGYTRYTRIRVQICLKILTKTLALGHNKLHVIIS